MLIPIFSKTSSIWLWIYTGIYAKKFKSFGENTMIFPKLNTLIGGEYIEIGRDCYLGKMVSLTAYKFDQNNKINPNIQIGDNTGIGDFCHITAINSIKIGNNVLLGKNILITDNAHGSTDHSMINIAPIKRPMISKGEVIIEDNVWIGEKSTILPGVHIGYGAIIGANSVVTKDIPAGSIAVGNPARLIKSNSQFVNSIS